MLTKVRTNCSLNIIKADIKEKLNLPYLDIKFSSSKGYPD